MADAPIHAFVFVAFSSVFSLSGNFDNSLLYTTNAGLSLFQPKKSSIHHRLDRIEVDGVVAPVVRASGGGGFVSGHLPGDFQLAVILQI